VRVDDARHDELAGEIDYRGIRDRDPACRSHLAYASALDDQRDVPLRRSAAAVDEGGMGENRDLRCCARREP
jgi:hypothetical protein